jgi:hypothetical protein
VVVPTARARPLAHALRALGVLVYSEPDVPAGARTQSKGPGSLAQFNGWRNLLVAPGLQPPPAGPLLALIDSQLDATHPAIVGGHIHSTSDAAPIDEHATATSGVAAGLDSNLGFTGIWPGANATDIPTGLECGAVAQGVAQAIALHAAVINMSLSSPHPCFTLFLALMGAVAHGILPVASAGNEFLQGNPLAYPASWPHILTVGAITASLAPAFFSTRNLGVDLGAPGAAIVAPVPPSFDTDGDRDGYMSVSGTSISAPMVAALADWIKALRPTLDGQQIATLLRVTARHLSRKGYSPDTGYGLPDLAQALQASAPVASPLEPNDDIPFVNGQLSGQAQPYVWKGQGKLTLSGGLDAIKNPSDVYRVALAGHSVSRLRLRSSVGITSLAVFGAQARSTAGHAIARRRRITRAATLRLANRRGPTYVYVQAKVASLASFYTLTFSS